MITAVDTPVLLDVLLRPKDHTDHLSRSQESFLRHR